MATGRKGQQWGTVGVKDGVIVAAWVDKGKREKFKALCKKNKITMSLEINRFISGRLARAGIYEPSQSNLLEGA